MPVWSKDAQYAAAAGFVIIVGVVATQFGFSAKLVLALLAGVGVLFCASLFDGLPRAAMIGASAVLLLLVAYNLATTCDSACQQSRAEAAQQRAAQEQARAARTGLVDPTYCSGQKIPHNFGREKGEPVNRTGECFTELWYQGHCIYAQQANETKRLGPYCDTKGGSNPPLPEDVEYVWSADQEGFDGYIRRSQPHYVSFFH
jgi:hypothetical protein